MPARRHHPSAEVLPCSKEAIPGFEDATASSPPPSHSLVLPSLENNTWEAKKNLYPHLGFRRSWKGFQGDWEVVGKTRLVIIGSVSVQWWLLVGASMAAAEPRMPLDTFWQQCCSSRAKEQLFPALPSPGRHFFSLCAETNQNRG